VAALEKYCWKWHHRQDRIDKQNDDRLTMSALHTGANYFCKTHQRHQVGGGHTTSQDKHFWFFLHGLCEVQTWLSQFLY